MVRLRVKLLGDQWRITDLFQFQYGAVESEVFRLIRPIFYDFNSSMVRLRDRIAMRYAQWLDNFNSSMVRLRANTLLFYC